MYVSTPVLNIVNERCGLVRMPAMRHGGDGSRFSRKGPERSFS